MTHSSAIVTHTHDTVETSTIVTMQWSIAWCRKHSAVTVTEFLQPLDLTCGTLFRFSCAIQTTPSPYVMSGLHSWTGREFRQRGPAAAKVCCNPVQSRHHLWTVQTTAEGTPFSASMNTALCDFW